MRCRRAQRRARQAASRATPRSIASGPARIARHFHVGGGESSARRRAIRRDEGDGNGDDGFASRDAATAKQDQNERGGSSGTGADVSAPRGAGDIGAGAPRGPVPLAAADAHGKFDNDDNDDWDAAEFAAIDRNIKLFHSHQLRARPKRRGRPEILHLSFI